MALRNGLDIVFSSSLVWKYLAEFRVTLFEYI